MADPTRFPQGLWEEVKLFSGMNRCCFPGPPSQFFTSSEERERLPPALGSAFGGIHVLTVAGYTLALQQRDG